MKKILIAGIGGTGGFFGGKLAFHFADSLDTEIHFLGRGENLNAIRRKGLLVKYEDQSFIAHPKTISDDPGDIGIVDLLICCTKTYDLEKTLIQLRPCIAPETVILPLQNGVDGFERTQKLYPHNEIWQGCVYIISRLVEPGAVVDTGNLRRLLFGSTKGSNEKLVKAEMLFKSAGIDTVLSSDIVKAIWEKFSFISPLASATSYCAQNIGQLLEDPESSLLLNSLFNEFKSVAAAKGISLPGDIIERSWERLRSLPYETTSSMHSDVRAQKQTEVESLTGYIHKEATRLDVKCPVYAMVYQNLTEGVGNMK